ncbi:MAG: DNA repair protein RecN [Homoserinimonas sp.]|nr:DNA repair protein RecN [Homoserinimonas sp.]MCW5944575.1 DNA repair protein RecN [Cryobacterium sp.]
MIEELVIRDLGVIGSATLPLGAGLTVLTGETGAGKTMVVTALGLLLGERADSQILRRGSAAAVVEGHWLVDSDGEVARRTTEAGGDLDPIGDGRSALVLGRTVTAEGRSRALVGGRSTPVGVLSELGAQLVVVHGQSDQIRLRSASAQREALDRFGGPEIATALGSYQETFESWQGTRRELDVLVAERDRRSKEAEELRLAIDEIERLAPRKGEDLELAERAERLGNLEDLRIAAAAAHEALSAQAGDDSRDAIGLVEGARRQVDRVAAFDPELARIAEAIASASFAVSEAASQLAGYLAGLDAEGAIELESVQERRAELSALARKHGGSLDETLELLESGSRRLMELDQDSDRIESLESEVTSLRSLLIEQGDRLSQLRKVAASRLAASVTEELKALAMADAEIVVEVAQSQDYSTTGRDQVSFLLKPHRGAEPRPLGRGASGGELSRVMLAIEVVIAASDPVPTFIFDEIDAGVGGASAIEIGKRLARLARSAQVIVVTHLPQVAAFASNHLRVLKSTDGEITESSVQRLEGDDRAEELTRMLSGLSDSESGMAHARELLQTAQRLA